MRFLRTYAFPLFLLLAGLGMVSYAAYNRYEVYKYRVFQQERRDSIKAGVQKVFENCPNISDFASRRDCLKNQLTNLRSSNNQVKLNYKISSQSLDLVLTSTDLGDLVEINKDPNLTFVRCSSNTFFLDWTPEKVFLSLENPLGSVWCTTTQGENIYIMPSDLTADQITFVKSSLSRPIQ